MPTTLTLDTQLVDRAVAVSGEETQEAVITRALQEFIARHEQRRLLGLFGSLDWDATYDYKAERSRSMKLLVDTSVWSLALRRNATITVPDVEALREAITDIRC